MGSAIARRIRRLEQRPRSREDDELIEVEFSEEGKDLLRDVLTGLMTPEEIEATVNRRRLIPRSRRPRLSAEGRAILEETLKGLTSGYPPSRSGPLTVSRRGYPCAKPAAA
jgi:hypothetical protein